MNPLQERARQLRAGLQQQTAEEKGYQQQHSLIVGEQLAQLFSTDFPELYPLLIQSQISVAGAISPQSQQVILSSGDKQLTIYYQGAKDDLNIWRFHGKNYLAFSIESEHRLIIALAQAFELAQSKKVVGK